MGRMVVRRFKDRLVTVSTGEIERIEPGLITRADLEFLT
jgi:hypothetical protein